MSRQIKAYCCQLLFPENITILKDRTTLHLLIPQRAIMILSPIIYMG
ncbi:hypothetical protein BOVAB4_1056 [Bacteroides ovatus]|nr:hypothetical protein BOVA713_1251 [Bacteroides ovatus]CAG9907635.1 hypothetical protein BOVAB4_1056 [Bacteroides ovatus]